MGARLAWELKSVPARLKDKVSRREEREFPRRSVEYRQLWLTYPPTYLLEPAARRCSLCDPGTCSIREIFLRASCSADVEFTFAVRIFAGSVLEKLAVTTICEESL